MKVTGFKTIDVEFEADISIDDVLNELRDIIDDAEGYRRVMAACDVITRMLAAIQDETIEAMPTEARELICERLMDEAARYDPAP